MLTGIIIDDEQFSVDALLKYIDAAEKIDIKEVFINPQDAIERVSSFDDIDILFLDVNMPNLSGLEIARLLRPKVKKVIFTTSHSKYAFDAFDVEGDAFLLKPYSYAKFLLTVNRLFPVHQDDTSRKNLTQKAYFLVKNKDEDLKVVNVAFNEVIYFESFLNYIKIHLIGNRVITCYLTLKDILQILSPRNDFIQFHRAYIISVNQINYIESHTITLKNGFSFPVGERFKKVFQNYLSDNLLKTLRHR
jgi:DNA-binding LytR/AlgR family response regulator